MDSNTTFGHINKGKLLKECLSEDEINDILDDSKYTYYTVSDLNKVVGVDIEVC